MNIRIANLRKAYGGMTAVDDLTLDIAQGTVFGLLGPNGAGKTTTFKCMLGLARPSSGAVFFDGKPLEPAVFERITYVPERSVLYDGMSARDHLELSRRAFRTFDPARAQALFERFAIDPRRPVGRLSKGMRTAVMVALAFARNADVLILDEPTSGLDPVNQRHVLGLIVNEATQGRTVIFSSHQIGQVERAAERIAIVDRGRLVLEGAVDDLKADRKIVEGVLPSEEIALDAFTGDARVTRVDRDGRIVRVLTDRNAEGVAASLEALGAAGVRVVDLNLEDIFLYAVSPVDATAAVVEGANPR